MMSKRVVIYLYSLLIIGSFALFSCSSINKVSKFSSSSIALGATKESILAEFGEPVKSEFWKNDTTGFYEERVYYKETFAGKAFESPYTITNILFFIDGKLKSLTQGQEVRLHDQRNRQKED